MKNLTFFILLSLLLSANLDAAVHRVNNTGADADFSTIQAAHNAALAGDSLYIEASPSTYGNLIISKKIHLFGPGYRLAQNIELQANVSSAKVNIITLQNGCSETTIQGMYIESYITSSNQSFSDLIISRNIIIGGISINSALPIEDIFIIGNEIYGSFNGVNALKTTGTSPKNIIVLNNIFRSSSYAHINLAASTSAVFTNNIFQGHTITVYNSNFQNNILLAGTIATYSTSTFSNNLSIGTQFPSGNDNIQNVAESSIFVGWPALGSYTEDSRFELAAGSPAIGSGYGGADCGVYAGPSPYILSGIPPIPTIYKFESPNVVTGNFTITLSTRSNN